MYLKVSQIEAVVDGAPLLAAGRVHDLAVPQVIHPVCTQAEQGIKQNSAMV